MSRVAIVVAPHGFVYVGVCEVTLDEVRLSPGRCIRRWGTTRGLGEIAAGGPTNDTILHDPAPVSFHRLAVHIIECDAAKWAKHLGGGK